MIKVDSECEGSSVVVVGASLFFVPQEHSHIMSTYLPEPIVARLVPKDQHQANNNRQTRDDAVWKTNVIVTDIVEVDDERRPQRAQDDRDCNVDMDCPLDEAQHQRPSSRLMPA
jgi:hypothetical protein